MVGESPAESQSLLQLLNRSQVSAPVAQARAETSWLCKGQVPGPLHNNVLKPWLGGSRGAWGAGTLQAGVTRLAQCEELLRDLPVIFSAGVEIGVGKGMTLSPGGID